MDRGWVDYVFLAAFLALAIVTDCLITMVFGAAVCILHRMEKTDD